MDDLAVEVRDSKGIYYKVYINQILMFDIEGCVL
jgi:hypothetical protein